LFFVRSLSRNTCSEDSVSSHPLKRAGLSPEAYKLDLEDLNEIQKVDHFRGTDSIRSYGFCCGFKSYQYTERKSKVARHVSAECAFARPVGTLRRARVDQDGKLGTVR